MASSNVNTYYHNKLFLVLKSSVAPRLRISGLIFIAVAFFACTTLPEPEMKTLTLAYDPNPDARLAVASRNLTEEVDEGGWDLNVDLSPKR